MERGWNGGNGRGCEEGKMKMKKAEEGGSEKEKTMEERRGNVEVGRKLLMGRKK